VTILNFPAHLFQLRTNMRQRFNIPRPEYMGKRGRAFFFNCVEVDVNRFKLLEQPRKRLPIRVIFWALLACAASCVKAGVRATCLYDGCCPASNLAMKLVLVDCPGLCHVVYVRHLPL
jgi:hypothetical protein